MLSVALLGAFTQAFDGVILNSLQASVAAPSALQVSAGEGPISRAGFAPPPTLELARAPFCEKLVRRWLNLRLRSPRIHKQITSPG